MFAIMFIIIIITIVIIIISSSSSSSIIYEGSARHRRVSRLLLRCRTAAGYRGEMPLSCVHRSG